MQVLTEVGAKADFHGHRRIDVIDQNRSMVGVAKSEATVGRLCHPRAQLDLGYRSRLIVYLLTRRGVILEDGCYALPI